MAGVSRPGKLGVERLAIHFRKTLGGAQDGNRLDRFVRRDHDHGGRAGGDRGIGDVDRTEHVGFDTLAPIALQIRDVLQRGGVKHDVRLEFLEQEKDALAVAHVGNASIDVCL